MKTIQAVVVLYKETIAGSPTCVAMLEALRSQAVVREHVELLVADNSPEAQAVPDGFPGRYVHDGRNPGLANRYNMALRAAAERDMRWLLLLDQDTGLTMRYLDELLTLSQQLAGNEKIASIVPKLVQKGKMISPHLPPYRQSNYKLDLSTYGPIPGPVKIFNSGALVRVKALQKIGGFPEAYPLDYLDHATFQQIEERGGRFFLMNARLEHELSVSDPDRYQKLGYAARRIYKLWAEIRFYREFGTLRDRSLHRMDLAREAGKALLDGRYAEVGHLVLGILSWPGAL